MSEALNMEAMDAIMKFNKDNFNDPVLRCDSCQALLLRKDLHKFGRCQHCGNTRVRSLLVFNEQEYAQLKNWTASGQIDPDFIKVFEGVEE